MKNLIVDIGKFLIFNIVSIYLKNGYLRLTFGLFGRVLILDYKKWELISLLVRSRVDISVVDQIFTRGTYRIKVPEINCRLEEQYHEILSSGKIPIILDCGANIGVSAVYFSRQFPEAQIIAIEPDQDNFNQAVSNTIMQEKVQCIRGAISSKKQYLSIKDTNAESWAIQVSDEAIGNQIEAFTVDELLNLKIPNGRLFCVKVDIEGFEDDLFASDCGWLADTQCLMIELHDWMIPGGLTSQNFLKAVADLDRDFFHDGETIFSVSVGENAN